MRRPVWMVAIALGVIAAWSIGRLQAQGDKVTFSNPNHATFTEMPNAGRTGVSSATLWGDPTAAPLAPTPNSSLDGMLGGTPTPPMCGS